MPSTLQRAMALRLSFLLALIASGPLAAHAQGAELTVRYQNGGPTTDGWSSASAQIRYAFLACGADLVMTTALVPNSVQPSGNYWFQGKSYSPAELPETDYSESAYVINADVMRAGDARVGSVNYETHKGWGESCFGAVNSTKVGSLSALIGPQRTLEQTKQYLASLYLSARPAAALRSFAAESRIKYMAQQAAAEAARAERDRQAQAAQAERERQAQATQAAQNAQTARSERERQAESAEQARRAEAQRQFEAGMAAAAAKREADAAKAELIVEGVVLGATIASDIMASRRARQQREARAEAEREAERAERRAVEARRKEAIARDLARAEAQAANGSADDQYWVGVAYWNSYPPETSKVGYWLRRAAERGHPGAQLLLGNINVDGMGIKHDYREAVRWLTPLVDSDTTGLAPFNLGRIYMTGGNGIAQDSIQSEKMFRKALEVPGFDREELRKIAWTGVARMVTSASRRESARAELIAASRDNNGIQLAGARLTGVRFSDIGTNESHRSASHRTVFDAAEARYITAQFDFEVPRRSTATAVKVVCQRFGPGEPGNAETMKANVAGESTTFSLVTGGKGWKDPGFWAPGDYEYECYSGGELVAAGQFEMKEFPEIEHPKNAGRANELFQQGYAAWQKKLDTAAVQAFEESAKMRNASATLYMSNAYLLGRGVKRDTAEAFKYLRKAAERGNPAAQFFLAYRYGEGGRHLPLDSAAAFKWYRAAADLGVAAAQYELGYWSEMGLRVPRDTAAAVRWYRRAAAQGYRDARERLQFIAGEKPPTQPELLVFQPFDTADARAISSSIVEGMISSGWIARFQTVNGRKPRFKINLPKDKSEEQLPTSLIAQHLQEALIKSGVVEVLVEKVGPVTDYLIVGTIQSSVDSGAGSAVKNYEYSVRAIDVLAESYAYTGTALISKAGVRKRSP